MSPQDCAAIFRQAAAAFLNVADAWDKAEESQIPLDAEQMVIFLKNMITQINLEAPDA